MTGHLEQCGACREMAEDERRLAGAFEALSPPPLSSDLRASLARRMRREAPTPSERRVWWSHRLGYAMASAAAVLLVGLGIWASLDAGESAPVAVVSVVVGEVEQQASDVEGWRPVQAGDTLPPESRLLSRGSGMAILTTETGVSLMVAPETTLTLQGPSEIEFEAGRFLARAPRGIQVITSAGRITTAETGGRIALRGGSQNRIDVQVSGFSATWAALGQSVPIEVGAPVSLDPAAAALTATSWNDGEWGWLESLEQARARQLLRETHPSLLPERQANR